ncbi:MAG: hypothetical protein M0T78_03990 [Actinomycetota bacterium]|nr:hypothetical protein [Actinomycetota bacterium]
MMRNIPPREEMMAPGESRETTGEATVSTVAPAPEAPRQMEKLQTEFNFVLPRGYVAPDGSIHREGTMRLATARDELLPLHDDRVRENPPYLTVVLLARVITRLGDLGDEQIHAGIVEKFFASDLAFLQEFYRRINAEGSTRVLIACPSCKEKFMVDMAGAGLGE